ncbi:MAG: YbbR-like domain-containing protein, partial [Candidatus Promineifilaceae bacterium]
MRSIRGALANITTLFLALILALVIWAAAVRASDPVATRILEIDVQTVGIPAQATMITSPPDTVFITIEGPESTLENTSSAEFQAIIDLSETPYAEVEVPIDVIYTGDDTHLTIISQSPEAATVRMEQIITREIPISVQVRGDVARGHTRGETRIEPDTVQITGPSPRVSNLAEGRVTILVVDAKEDVSQERPPTFYVIDGNVASVVGLTVSPAEVS